MRADRMNRAKNKSSRCHRISPLRFDRWKRVKWQRPPPSTINRRFTAKLRKSSKPGGWTYVIWPESVKFFGTRGLVKIKGTIDGHPFRSSFMAIGNGRHMLPVRADVRQAIGKQAGDSVTVRLNARINR
jgi:uncharacterized protein DUF1905